MAKICVFRCDDTTDALACSPRNAPAKCFLTSLEYKVRTGRGCGAATSWSLKEQVTHLARSLGIEGNVYYDDLAHVG